jgi:hypothetical protein
MYVYVVMDVARSFSDRGQPAFQSGTARRFAYKLMFKQFNTFNSDLKEVEAIFMSQTSRNLFLVSH